MKKALTLFIATLFVTFGFAQQPILWGMTSMGGAGDNGTIFNVLANGDKFKANYSFPEINPGAGPQHTQLCQASNGLLYGLTSNGGCGYGVLFSYNPSTTAYTSLVIFTNDISIAPGAHPNGSLIQGTDGKLYGMTSAGGTEENGDGLIFSYDPTTNLYTDLYEFTGFSGGSQPQGSLYQSPTNGLLYGMTSQGGNSGQGDIFSYDPVNLVFTELTDLANVDPNISNPTGGLIQANDGKLYGMASSGHLFSSDLSGNATLLVTMDDNGSFPGSNPQGDLLVGGGDSLYGLTSSGGANENGVLFLYKTSNKAYTDLYDFNNDQAPTGNLIKASNGTLYGFASQGGNNSDGSIFSYEISNRTFTSDYSFSGSDGSSPQGTPVEVSGSLYGLTNSGGASGSGTLFSLSLTNTFDSILSFQSDAPYGASPQSSLVMASNGQLYGMAAYGGDNGVGTLFTVNPTNGAFTYLYSFDGSTGELPIGDLMAASNGLLYGMTLIGGDNEVGALFSFDPSNPANPPVNLYSFTGGAPDYCSQPLGDLFQAKDGLLYGMTQYGGVNTVGNIFSFDPANPGNAPVNLYSFDNGDPTGSLMQASNGLLYGMTPNGGNNGVGNIFSFDPANPSNPAIDLYDFTNGAPDYGAYPFGNLIQANDGKLYGMTEVGGNPTNYGNIFSFDPANPSNAPVDLVDLVNVPDAGTNPGGSLMQATDGNLYGITYGGGANFSGVIFKYDYINNVYSNVHDFAPIEGQFSNFGSLIQVGVSSIPVDTFIGYTNDWMVPSNWSMNTVPDSVTNVVVPSLPVGGNFPQITYQGSTQDILMQDGATLDLGRDGLLSVYGSWTGGTTTTSTVTGFGGTVQLVGTSVQPVSGITNFQTLLANNIATELKGGADIGIYNQLILQGGQFNTSLNPDSLKLIATSSSSYGILQMAGGTYVGNITAQCFYNLPTTVDSYSQHMMGSPVDAPFLAQFGAAYTANGYLTDANCDETKIDANSVYGTVFQYQESQGAACEVDQWYVMSSEDLAVDGQGYSVVLTGSGVFSITGAPNLKSSYTISGTNSNWNNHSLQNRPYNSGWVLMSNPYPAPLVISSASISQNLAAGWDAQIQVWNTTGTNAGSYQPTTTLAPFQAFMVHVTNPGSATYTINGSDQVYTSTPTFYRQASDEQLTVTATNTTTGLTDNTTVGFSTLATDSFDPAIDINKFPGQLTRHTLYTTNLDTNQWLCNNILYSIAQTGSVPMGFESGIDGSYTLHFDGVTSFDPTSYLSLLDNQSGTTYNIRSGDYSFTASAADNWNRFVLLFTPAAQINTTNATCNTAGTLNIVQPGVANWNYTLTDASSTTLSTGALNSATPVNINLIAGVYTLTLVDGNGYTVVKSVQVNGDPAVIATFNPVDTAQANTVVSFSSLTQNATDNSWSYGDGTTGTGSAVTHTYTIPGTYTVTLTSTNDSGCTAVVSHTITITSISTGIQNITGNNIKIWGNENMVNVSFAAGEVTTVKIYNELGQQLVSDQLTTGNLYTKVINIETGYVIVMVNNGQQIATGKVFINSNK